MANTYLRANCARVTYTTVSRACCIHWHCALTLRPSCIWRSLSCVSDARRARPSAEDRGAGALVSLHAGGLNMSRMETFQPTPPAAVSRVLTPPLFFIHSK
jgi:hypothetical protein